MISSRWRRKADPGGGGEGAGGAGASVTGIDIVAALAHAEAKDNSQNPPPCPALSCGGGVLGEFTHSGKWVGLTRAQFGTTIGCVLDSMRPNIASSMSAIIRTPTTTDHHPRGDQGWIAL